VRLSMIDAARRYVPSRTFAPLLLRQARYNPETLNLEVGGHHHFLHHFLVFIDCDGTLCLLVMVD